MSNQMFRGSLSDRSTYFNAFIVFKCWNGLAPPYLQNKFSYVRDKHQRNTRQSTAGPLALPPLSNGNDLQSFKYCLAIMVLIVLKLIKKIHKRAIF